MNNKKKIGEKRFFLSGQIYIFWVNSICEKLKITNGVPHFPKRQNRWFVEKKCNWYACLRRWPALVGLPGMHEFRKALTTACSLSASAASHIASEIKTRAATPFGATLFCSSSYFSTSLSCSTIFCSVVYLPGCMALCTALRRRPLKSEYTWVSPGWGLEVITRDTNLRGERRYIIWPRKWMTLSKW